MCRSSSFPLQASATSDLRFARDPVRRIGHPPRPALPRLWPTPALVMIPTFYVFSRAGTPV